MGAPTIPLYKEQGRTYHADACVPLVDAMKRGELRVEALGRGAYPGRPLPPGILPGLRSVGFWDASRAQSWGLPWHRNEGIELTCLETGQAVFALERRRYRLQPGDLAITRPWQPHRIGDPAVGVGRLHWLILDVGVRQPHQDWRWPGWLVVSRDTLEDLTEFLRGNERPVWKAGPEMMGCFRQIGRTIASEDTMPVWSSRLAVYINELLVHLLERFRSQRVPITKSLSSARRSTGLFLSSLRGSLGERWTLDSMAESCGLGITRFAHYCRQVTNQTPLRYLNSLRVEKACEQLRRNPERSVTDIALDCGFSTSQYFATVFRRQMGRSPRSYRADCIAARGRTAPRSAAPKAT